MSIKFILQICEEFFDSIYSQGIDNLYDFDEEIIINEDDEDECYCNACSISRYILSVLHS
jgi:hypothetical protein